MAKSAVSQYVSSKRGKDITFPSIIEERIKELAGSLTGNDAVSNLCARVSSHPDGYARNICRKVIPALTALGRDN